MFNDLTSPQEDGKDAPSLGSTSLKLHKFWNMEPVYIQVGEMCTICKGNGNSCLSQVNKTVFAVPRDAFQGFSSGSSPFAEVGGSSASVAVENITGLSKARPIVLKNMTEHELETFLQVIYPFTV